MTRTPPRARQGGFVLVLVLVALVVITLLASAVAVVSERAVAEAQQEADAFAAELAGTSTRDTVLYMLATQRQTLGGITVDDQVALTAGNATATPQSDEFGAPLSRLPIGNEIRLDSTAYRGLGGVRFALQDDAGLFSLNWTPQVFRTGLFELIGVPPEEHASFEAVRLDYQDPDALYRLGGAEAAQYRDAGLPPPSNRTLVTPLEARRMLGWRDALAGMDDASVMRLLTASRSVVVNVNSATPLSLRMLPGVDEDTARRIVALRATMPFLLDWEFIRDFDVPLGDMPPIGMSAVGYGTLSLWHNASGPVTVVHWTLTPADEGGRPWQLDYEIILPRADLADPSLARVPETPLFAEPPAPGS